jgi:hypothetical protein
MVQRNTAPRAQLAGRMAHYQNQDKTRVIVFLSTGHREKISALLLVSVETTFCTDRHDIKIGYARFIIIIMRINKALALISNA